MSVEYECVRLCVRARKRETVKNVVDFFSKTVLVTLMVVSYLELSGSINNFQIIVKRQHFRQNGTCFCGNERLVTMKCLGKSVILNMLGIDVF